jgi:hypothetical protein
MNIIPVVPAERTFETVALSYAEQGIPVFPINRKTGIPHVKWGTKATTDPVVVKYWSRKWPRALVGTPTGNGLVVLDVDARHGGKPDPAWPVTLMATSPRSNGEPAHYYFRARAVIRNSTSKLAPGVDARGDGGMVYTIGNPGREWVNPGTPLATMPDWLITACQAAAGTRSDGSRAWRGPFLPAAAASGQPGTRHDYLVRFAGWVLHKRPDLDEATHAELVALENARVYPLHPDGPREADIERLANDIHTRDVRKPARPNPPAREQSKPVGYFGSTPLYAEDLLTDAEYMTTNHNHEEASA